tara:strand:+ start:1986 stop:4421 length:2436 start_codon:yes stop_codon:yes gene_type:complete
VDDEITVSSLAQEASSVEELQQIASQRGWSKNQLESAIKERFVIAEEAPNSNDKVGFFEQYCDLICREWGRYTSDKIRENVNETYDRMVWKNSKITKTNRSGYGLVVGRIQSGKTSHMIGLSMRAMDPTLNENGDEYNTVIILSGLLEDLRKQTYSRFLDLGVPGIRIFPREADFNTKNQGAKDELFEAFCNVEPCILVVKKNHTVIGAILEYLAEDEIDIQMGERRILIIDDECDHASIDSRHAESNENPDAVTQTNRAVRKLILSCLRSKSNQWYLGYTATPYSNLLMDPEPEYLHELDLGPSLFPRDMIHLLPRPKNEKGELLHFDNQIFFKGQGEPYIQRMETPPVGGGEERNHLREMLLMHALSKILRERNESVENHTTMIHTDTDTDEHLRIGEIVQSMKEEEYYDINDEQATTELVECAKKYYPDDIEYIQDKLKQIKESKFLRLNGYFRETNIVLLNSDKHKQDAEYEYPSELKYDSGGEVSIIVIGGHKLARGLTLEGLTVSWFARTSDRPNYDTLLQMSRWCGYRKDFLSLIRIFMNSDTIQHYHFITEVERRLRVDLKQFTKETNPLDEVQWIREYHGMCISGKLPSNLTEHPSSLKAISPEIVLQHLPENFSKNDVQETQSRIIEAFDDLMTFHTGDFVPGVGDFEVAKTSLIFIEGFIQTYADSYQIKCDSKKYIERLIAEISESEELSGDWNLVIHNPPSGKKTPDSGIRLSRLGFNMGDSNFIKIPDRTPRADISPGSTVRNKPMLCIFLEDPGLSFAGIPVYNDNGIPIVFIGFYLPPEVLSPAFIDMARPGTEI